MDDRSNVLATVSLVCGVGVWVLFFLGMCVSFIPFLGLFSFVFVFLEVMVAIVGVITGILGLRQARVTAVGQGSALAGLLLAVAWMVIEALLMAFTFGLLGLLFVAGALQ